MKKPLVVLGYFTTLITALYAVFKFVRIPHANLIMLLAGILIAIYFPLLILLKFRIKHEMKPHLVYKFGAFLLSILILSIVFSLQHWNISYRKGDEVIILFTIPSWIFNAAYFCFSFIFIPMLIYINFKIDKRSLKKNIVAGIGLALISFSLMGYQLKLPYHDTIFILGNALFFIVYLPWHILSSSQKESNGYHNIFQTLIIAYIIVLFVYGIILKWPVTYQDHIMNLK